MTDTFTITSIKREFNFLPNFVGIVTTADFNTITADGYLTDEDANITILNNGEFQWEVTDLVVIYYADNQIGFFQRDPVDNTFVSRSSINTAHVNITANDIKAMYATPFLLLPAPSQGRTIFIDSIVWDFTYGGAQFAGGGAIAAQYGNIAHGAGVIATTTIPAATLNALTANQVLTQGANTNIVASPLAMSNTAIYLSNQTAAFTTGTSNALLTVDYHILNI